ncbi:MAG: CinA family nicotinamide mononucleotide deamidase-related protein, partial [Flavobacteriales bacterium]|nr:CinA family nicotinamide mononucleotide deamidase-related protein [Flavobacteriales bacterium]
MKEIKGGIISIGDELLIGQTINTNAGWMGEILTQYGFTVEEVLTIADTRKAIVDALDYLLSQRDFVLMTGGLGPTKDDVTKHVLTDYFNTTLTMRDEVRERIEKYFNERGIPVLEVNRLQAMLPEDSTVIHNMVGTASGMWFDKGDQVVVSMPGVPYEMKHLMKTGVLPKLQEQYQTPTLYHRTLMTIGRGESKIAEHISELALKMEKDGVKIAYLPSAGAVRIRLSAVGEGDEVKNMVDTYLDEMGKLLEDIQYSVDDIPMELALANELKLRQATVAAAESCTGGSISALLAKHSGSSEYFNGGVTAYANHVKIDALGVKSESIEEHGAVSKEVVEQMAANVRSVTGSTYGVATSGIAGPTGATETKPVGTIWIAASGPNGTQSKLLQLGKSRTRNILVTTQMAMNLLRKSILAGDV